MSGGARPNHRKRGATGWLWLLPGAFLGWLVFAGLAHPLFWADEGETAMFGRRILEYGYPKVHGDRNVVYQFGPNIALGVDERTDAYIGTTWGQFYFAVPGLWWAQGTPDPWAKTARARLPFALAGALGLALFACAARPALPPRRRAAFTAAFLACACLSLSLVLHLREVRYYPLVVLLVGAIVFVQLRFAVFRQLGVRGYALAQGVLLFLLFNTFFAAFFSVLAALALERARHGVRALLPLLPALLAVAPLLLWFETLPTASAIARELALGPRELLENLRIVGAHLLRHEFLLPALVCRAALFACDRAAQRRGEPRADAALRSASAFVWLLAGTVALLGLANPLPLERYFVVTSPLFTLAFLLDAFALAPAVARAAGQERGVRAGRATVAALVALVLVARFSAFGEVADHLRSLGQPYRGPIDEIVSWVRERYPEPASLVIATNYEELPLMYYLDSHVIVGLTLANLVEDRRLEPELVIPRRRWRSSLPEALAFLRRGRWERETLPVVDLHYNNNPALSRSRFLPDPHRFETALPASEDEALVIYRRSSLPRQEPAR